MLRGAGHDSRAPEIKASKGLSRIHDTIPRGCVGLVTFTRFWNRLTFAWLTPAALHNPRSSVVTIWNSVVLLCKAEEHGVSGQNIAVQNNR